MFNGKQSKLQRIVAAILSVIALSTYCVIGAGATEEAEYESANARARSDSVYSSIPAGAYRLNVNVNGRQVLSGRVFNTGGTTYVPMLSFSYWVGDFKGSYNARTRTATLTGTNLKVTARAGDSYINANDRYFYTVGKVLLVGDEIYVPILPMVKALSSYVNWDSSSSSFSVRSGDSRLLRNGAQTYQADQVYWLSRIISAEAQGEPMEGKIAVGNVVLNRVLSSQFPNTIYGVIFDKKYGVQFSPVANGTIYNTPTMDSIIAAKICLEGYSLSDDVLYFVNPKKAPGSWISKNRPYAFTIGNHTFYN
jgi:N-acetylmuramoyl-L-alanine amidase